MELKKILVMARINQIVYQPWFGHWLEKRKTEPKTVVYTDEFIGYHLAGIIDSAKTQARALVLMSDSCDEVVVAFRGSKTLKNWALDLMFWSRQWLPWGKSKIDSQHSIRVETGFARAYDSIRYEVLDQTAKAMVRAQAKNPTVKLVVTGHSLGGAEANLFAMDLSVVGRRLGIIHEGDVVDVVTFGCPNTVKGNEDASFWTAFGKVFNVVDVVNCGDPVPGVPRQAWGYTRMVAANRVDVDASAVRIWSKAVTQSIDHHDIKEYINLLSLAITETNGFLPRHVAALDEGLQSCG